MYKLHRFMEYFWLIIAVGSLIVVVSMILKNGFKNEVEYLIFPALSGLMYGFRRGFRNRMERIHQEEMEKSEKKS